MKKETENYLEKTIAFLNMVGVRNDNITITGSVALDILGVLPEEHKIHDIDVFIKMDPNNLGVFGFWCEVLKAKETPSCIGSDSKMIRIFNEILVNIWFKPDMVTSNLTYKGIGLKTVDSILAVKKRYDRPKDIKDINQIVTKILN